VGVLDSLDFTSELARHMAGDMLWAYVLLALTTAPPLVPNAALLVTAGVLAAHGQLNIALVLLVVAGSALAGDMVIHRGGRALSGPVVSRLVRRPRRRRLLEWTASRIQTYGLPFVVACRFLPSGRLIGGLAAGIVRYPARRYLLGAGIAETVWATYSVGIGYLGGRSTGNAFYAIAFGLGVSLAVAGIGGIAQLMAGRRARVADPLPALALPTPSAAPTAPASARTSAPTSTSASTTVAVRVIHASAAAPEPAASPAVAGAVPIAAVPIEAAAPAPTGGLVAGAGPCRRRGPPSGPR
jgi:membrane protein DedA with SNARE-associated domain